MFSNYFYRLSYRAQSAHGGNMHQTIPFAPVADAILKQPYRTYKQIAQDLGVPLPSVLEAVAILKQETGFSRPRGRHSKKYNNASTSTDQELSTATIPLNEEDGITGDMSLADACAASSNDTALRYDEPTDCVWAVCPKGQPDLVGIFHRPNLPDDKGVVAPNTAALAQWQILHPETYTDWTPGKPEGWEFEPKEVQ
jgi:hypothetical protein